VLVPFYDTNSVIDRLQSFTEIQDLTDTNTFSRKLQTFCFDLSTGGFREGPPGLTALSAAVCKHYNNHQIRFLGSNYRRNADAIGALPHIQLGELIALTRLLSVFGGASRRGEVGRLKKGRDGKEGKAERPMMGRIRNKKG